MPIYKCTRCYYTSGRWSCMKSHLTRKNPCQTKYSHDECEVLLNNKKLLFSKPVFGKTNSNGNIYNCRHCDKTFKYCSSKSRHERTRCKYKKTQLDDTSNMSDMSDMSDIQIIKIKLVKIEQYIERLIMSIDTYIKRDLSTIDIE